MSKVNGVLDEVNNFLDGEGWDKEEFLIDLLSEIKGLKGCSADEIGLIWDDEELMDLDSFVNEFYFKLVDKIQNAVNSFKEV